MTINVNSLKHQLKYLGEPNFVNEVREIHIPDRLGELINIADCSDDKMKVCNYKIITVIAVLYSNPYSSHLEWELKL